MNFFVKANQWWCGVDLGHYWRSYKWGRECIKCGKLPRTG